MAEEGSRWVCGAADAAASAALVGALPWAAVRAAQSGLVADMDTVADADLRTASPLDPPEGSVMTELTSPTDRRRRDLRDHAERARRGPRFWSDIREGRYCISDVPPERWDPDLYYDPDPDAPDKTYSRIGGWVREFVWEPREWRLPLPPTVAAQMDVGQQWAVSAARAALVDAGWPEWNVDPERVAVIIGNAIGGEKHYQTTMRIQFPEFARDFGRAPAFASLPEEVRAAVLEQWRQQWGDAFPEITEDTMPGELANVIAGRVANLFNFRGPNFTTDAACASALAAMASAVQGLGDHQYDAVVTGGVDRNMGVNAFVKFCKIGALSATGTRPFDAGADGFVMGEGAALFVLKRLADAERDGDRIYAVLLGLGGSSDGKGKGITAPNPVGQRLAVERAWENAGLDPSTMGLVEAHGTSTRVGDAVELGEPHRGVRQGRRRTRLRSRSARSSPTSGTSRPPPAQPGSSRPSWPAREGAPAEPALRGPQPERGLGRVAAPGQHRAARVAAVARPACVAPGSAPSASVAPTSTRSSRSTSPAAPRAGRPAGRSRRRR